VACGRASRERTDWNRFRLKVHTGPRPGLLFVIKRLHSRDSSLFQNPHISPKARDDRIFALHSPTTGSRHSTALPQSLSTFSAHVPRILSSALASTSGSNVWGLLPARARLVQGRSLPRPKRALCSTAPPRVPSAAFEHAAFARGSQCPTKPRKVHVFNSDRKDIT
jgi:hypothetical protein